MALFLLNTQKRRVFALKDGRTLHVTLHQLLELVLLGGVGCCQEVGVLVGRGEGGEEGGGGGGGGLGVG